MVEKIDFFSTEEREEASTQSSRILQRIVVLRGFFSFLCDEYDYHLCVLLFRCSDAILYLPGPRYFHATPRFVQLNDIFLPTSEGNEKIEKGAFHLASSNHQSILV